MDNIHLVIFAGLPGTGKSSLAEKIGQRLLFPVFAKDRLEATLKRCELRPKNENSPNLGYVGYELLTMLAEQQLKIQQSAILDSVASIEKIRQEWRLLAKSYDANWSVIECICSDESAHRQRLLDRQRDIQGWHELTWSDVERVKSYYSEWAAERLIIDSMDPLEENCQRALTYIQRHHVHISE